MARNLRVNIKKSNFPYCDIIDFVSTEGMQPTTGFGSFYPTNYLFDGVQTPSTNGATAGTIASNISVGSVRPPLTKRYFINGLSLWASEPVIMRAQVGGASNVYQGVVGSNGIVMPTNFFLNPQEPLGVNIKGRVNAGTGGVVATATARITTLSVDVDYNADYTMLCIADSNTEGTSCENATSAWDIYTWLLKKNLQDNHNINIRIVDKSLANTTTNDYENNRLKGFLSLPFNPSIILYNLGTNNPGNVADNLYSTHLQNLVDWKKTRYPNSILILISPCPNGESTSKQNTLATLRNTMQNIVNSSNVGVANTSNNYIYYCEFGNLFDPNTQASTYFTSSSIDNNGKIHMNKAAQILAANRLYETIINNNIINKIV
jgi:lysophospholipase L1-like esterase